MFKKLLILIGLLVSTPAFAATITVQSFSADSGVSHLNNFRSTVVNVINGNIEGSTDGGANVSNIAADSVYEINMANDANPRVRDAELLSIGVDTLSGSTLDQDTFAYSGCIPATDSDLTSDISACVAYVNGYRISIGATSQTYTANRDTYVDLSQSGSYNLSAVANGASAPAVAANSARIAKVVTNGTAITTSTDLARRSLSGLVVPSNYRDGLVVSRDSATTVTVFPGTVEINNTMVSKTSTTTLTLGTNGDWAGGTSLSAADTFGFVGVDASGNLKLHTTAPTHSNYAVSVTDGKKRYATWSSTVYRILGWFYMNGASQIDRASNIKDPSVSNTVISSDANILAVSATSYTNIMNLPFYNSGGNILIMNQVSGDAAGGGLDGAFIRCTIGGVDIAGCGAGSSVTGAGGGVGNNATFLHQNRPQGTATYGTQMKVSANSINLKARNLVLQEQ